MSKMDQFVEAMKVAFALAQELTESGEGISQVNWNIRYSGTTEATMKISADIGAAMKKAGLINVEEGAA